MNKNVVMAIVAIVVIVLVAFAIYNVTVLSWG